MRWIILNFLISAFCFGYDASPKCLYELEVRFFEPRRVKEAFDLYRVLQNQWDPIVFDLSRNAKEVPKLVKEKARRLSTNPLEHPFNPEKTVELLIEAEYEVFRNTMLARYYFDANAISGMFEYVKGYKMEEINACLIIPYQKKDDRK